MHATIRGQMVNNQRTRVGRCCEINRNGNNEDNRQSRAQSIPRETFGVRKGVHDIVSRERGLRSVELTDGSYTWEMILEDQRSVSKGYSLLWDIVAELIPWNGKVIGVVVKHASKVLEFVSLASLAKCNTSPHREPQNAVSDGSDERVENDLANCAATRNTSNEKTDKARPSDPVT